MTNLAGSDVQRAIAFLSDPGWARGGRAPLPAEPDYDSLARLASGHGHHVSPAAVAEAFGLMMRARLVVSRKPLPTDGDGP